MAKKAEQVVPEIIDSVEGLNAKMAAMREAQKVFATYTTVSYTHLSDRALKSHLTYRQYKKCLHLRPVLQGFRDENCKDFQG